MDTMSQTVSKNSYFLNGLDLKNSTQSILDVLVMQGLLSSADALKLKSKYRTNREVENFLLKNRIVSSDTINKAYSILLKIPYVSLVNFKIPKEVLPTISKQIAVKFKVIPFGVKNGSLQLAICNPSELSTSFNRGLEKIVTDKHLSLDLYITSKADFESALNQYDGKEADLMTTGSYPVVFLRNQSIKGNLLGKLPLDFARKYRAIVFYQKSDNVFAIACEKPDDSALHKALKSLEDANKISFQIFATSKEDIDFALSEYSEKLDKTKEKTVKVKVEEPEKIQSKKPSEDDEIITLSSLFNSFLGSKPEKESAIKIDNFGENSAKIAENQNPEEKAETKSDGLEVAVLPETTEKKEDPAPDLGDEIEPKTDLDEVTKEELPKKDPEENIEENEKNLGTYLDSDITTAAALDEILKSASAPKVVAALINFALFERASDIHVEPEQKILRIRFRIDGVLRDVAKLALSLHPPIISRIKILSKLKIDETRIPQDGRFDVAFKNREVDVRVSSLPTVHGEKIVMRILDKDQGILSLEDLGMVGRAFDLTIDAITKPFGIILSTGPTGSGKSTTLYAIINRISKPSVNIVTLEDPVEYEIPGVNQCQVKPAIGFSFAEGLRSVLRQDPNVVMVGEIRDGETAGMATHAALTGHLVLSTLHTNDAPGALPRFTNMGIEPFLITSSINVIIGQRLVRRICPKCKEEMKVPQAFLDEVKQELSAISDKNQVDRKRIPAAFKFYHGFGCSNCSQGYVGRIGIFEVLRMTPDIESLTVEKRPANEIRDAAIKDGMITMKQDGILKALEGLTTIDEVFRATTS